MNDARLFDMIEIIGGGTPKRDVSEYWDGDIDWLSVKDFNNGERYVHNADEKITESGLNKSSTKLLAKGDIVISARGTVGCLAQLAKPMAFNQSCYGIRGNEELDNDFLYYWLKTKIVELQKNSHGAVFDTITTDTFKILYISLLPIAEQKAIASVLGALDDKIELNRRMNQTLEAMAQALFKSWFVDFDPVIDNALAAGNKIPAPLKKRAAIRKALGNKRKPLPEHIQKLFPAEFQHSKEMGYIPKSWQKSSLGDISNLISKGTTPRKEDTLNKQETIPFIKVKDIDDCGNISSKLGFIPEDVHLVQLKRSILCAGDLLFSIAGTIGRVAILPAELNNSNCNQAIAFIKLKNIAIYQKLVFQYLNSDRLQYEVYSKIVQGVQANASLRNLSDLTILIPDGALLNEFNKHVNSYYDALMFNKMQTKVLANLRDTLLPKLLSGKIRIPDAEKLVK